MNWCHLRKSMNRTKFRNLIRESVQEFLTENPSIDLQRAKLKVLIKRMIRENMQTKKDEDTPNDSYDPQDVKDRVRQEKERDEGKSFEDILKKLSSAAKSIDPKIIVSFDDHKDFNVEVPQAFRVRISPRWENNFDVEAFVESNDRIKVIGLTLDQVIDFIKTNFADKVKDNVKKAMDKVDDQKKDKTKIPKPDVDGTKGVKEFKPEKKTQDMTKKDEDLPGAQMREVPSDVKRQNKFTDKDNKVSPPKHKLDKELVKRMKSKKD